MLKYLLGLFIFLGFSFVSFGQFLSPLESYPANQGQPLPGSRNARTTAVGDTLNLPFFDDFTGYTGQPSRLYWQKGGGVYVNNQFGINPPSLNVATFEGLTTKGDPYSVLTSYGPTDTLTSKPIYLHNLNPATDSVYLSFYLQAGGLGGSPDSSTASRPVFLQVEFKDKNNNWVEVWQQPGQGKKTGFIQVSIPVNSPNYFYKGFQFRFRSSGVRKGNGDSWNVDYVYLARKQNPNKPNRPDVAISQNLTSLLERYTAMPASQFFVNPAAELNDSAFTRINNFNYTFAPIAWRGYVKTISPVTPADTFLRGNAPIPPLARQYLITGKPTAAGIAATSNSLIVKHSIFLTTLEKDKQLRQNDTVSRLTVLNDFFAYDDGTAETNFSLNNFGNRQLAYRFDLNKPDNIKAIRVYISKTNRPGTVMTFRVWDDDNGQPASTVKASKSFTIPVVDSLNRFYDIALNSSVPVSGKFYIGFFINSTVSDFVNIGFDFNESAPGRIFYNNAGTGWLPFNDEKGALLLRPVMGTVTGTKDDIVKNSSDLTVYPNPGNGIFTIVGTYQNLCLKDISGKTVLCKSKQEVSNGLDLRHLAKGMYILQVTNKNKIETKKIILTAD